MDEGLLSLKWNNHRSSFIHVLSSLRKKDLFCDVTLACDGKFYPSHKLVLSTCSEYFQEMFQQTQCKHPVIVLKDIYSEDLEALLNYMYLGEVNVVQEKLSTLIKSAECLRIKGLAVPDDPPRDSHSDKRNSGSHNDGMPESKRRKTDSEHRHKDSPRSRPMHSSKTNADSAHTIKRSMTVVHEEPRFLTPSHRDSENDGDQLGYDYNDNGADQSSLNKKDGETNSIKQEPPDQYVEDIDSKVGILENVHTFVGPISQDDTPPENIGASEAQQIWAAESGSADSFSPIEMGGSGDGTTQNESVWEEEQLLLEESDWARSSSTNVGTAWPPPLSEGSSQAATSSYSTSSIQGTAPYSCPMCAKTFCHKGNYKKHIQTHTGERPFLCRLCGYRATQKIHVLRHIQRKHI